MTIRLIEGPDSRRLAVAESGDPGGRPVVKFHGAPGALVHRMPNDVDVCAAGIRLITYDRPGYGDSDRQPGRRVVDCVSDVEAIADALGGSKSLHEIAEGFLVIAVDNMAAAIRKISVARGHDVTRYYRRAVTIMDAEQLGGTMIEQLAGLFEDD